MREIDEITGEKKWLTLGEVTAILVLLGGLSWYAMLTLLLQ